MKELPDTRETLIRGKNAEGKNTLSKLHHSQYNSSNTKTKYLQKESNKKLEASKAPWGAKKLVAWKTTTNNDE